MIPRMRAIAIDDQQEHLHAIHEAATSAGFGCVPLLYPKQTDSEYLQNLELRHAHVRIIISDLHLNATSETSDVSASYAIIGGLIEFMGLAKWTPYALVLWTSYPDQVAGLQKYLEERLSLDLMPGLLFGLDKADYGIPSGQIDHKKLLEDLRDKVAGSRGLNVLFQWEKELIQAADNVVRKLLKAARDNKNKSIQIDAEIDRVLSLIAQTATSNEFASNEPRVAANEGLLPLLTDEMEHLDPGTVNLNHWKSAMNQAVEKNKISPTSMEAAVLNDALHISRDGTANGSDRGAVVTSWHTDESFKTIFGIDKNDAGFKDIFGLEIWPSNASIKYVQIEGLCDSTQKKAGVVPFVLACEVLGDTKLKGKCVSASVETSPIYLNDKEENKELKLIVNLRYFFTSERSDAKTHQADFRLRESLINKWAFAWAKHAIRPGTVEFHTK